ncbi:hypothetical protein Hanom_Chr00s029381g01769021 [Helianthus anomalus]
MPLLVYFFYITYSQLIVILVLMTFSINYNKSLSYLTHVSSKSFWGVTYIPLTKSSFK